MLAKRLITACLLSLVVVGIIFYTDNGLFALICSLIFMAAQWEWLPLCGWQQKSLRLLLSVPTAVAFAWLWHYRQVNDLWLAVIIIGAVWWLASILWLKAYTFMASSSMFYHFIKAIVGYFVLIPAWAAAILLQSHGLHGAWWLLFGLLLVWAADTGAYFAGRWLGHKKLAPNVSPGKTWAGAWGGCIVALLVAITGGFLAYDSAPRIMALALLGVIIAWISIVGDLVESLIKRHAGIKDSGSILPGHGGLLDRMDSSFAALPVFLLGLLLIEKLV